MTRFLLSLDDAVDTIFAAVQGGLPGETYIPRVPSAQVTNIAKALIGERPIETRIVGVRPGEKIHEILISDEEAHRAVERGAYYVILPMLPELRNGQNGARTLSREYSSGENVMSLEETTRLLRKHALMPENVRDEVVEVLR
jgi:UDP-glucose 4-epimerase